ncbi:hypothetical protein [Sphingopyxis macrogoltabida]|nr:hypothetical protein [Sphingopyxis macrogoltabida]
MLAFYEASLEQSAHSAVDAFFAYGRAIDGGQSEIIIARHLHDAMTHCAAISRFFWPPAKPESLAARRGAALRKQYGVSDHSPLANRELRNALEHFDERLDSWILSGPVGPIMASPIVAAHSIVDDGFGHAFKVIDIENDIYVILGKKFPFGELAKEVSRLLIGGDETMLQEGA